MLNGWRRYADRCPRLVEAAFLVLLCAATGAQNDRGPGWWPGLLLATPAPDADPAPTGDLTARKREVTANWAAPYASCSPPTTTGTSGPPTDPRGDGGRGADG